jgi:hypothetical protein
LFGGQLVSGVISTGPMMGSLPTKKMRAAVLTGPGQMRVEEVERP